MPHAMLWMAVETEHWHLCAALWFYNEHHSCNCSKMIPTTAAAVPFSLAASVRCRRIISVVYGQLLLELHSVQENMKFFDSIDYFQGFFLTCGYFIRSYLCILYETQIICESRKDVPSDVDSEHSQLDTTPQHLCVIDIPTNHHTVLKKHLQTATFERGQLQQTAAELEEKAERLRYELADAQEAAKSQDEVVVLLQKQLSYLESVHSSCLEDAQHHHLRIANLEQELTHLQDICHKQEEEKVKLQELIVNKKDNKNEGISKLPMKDEDQELLSASENPCLSFNSTEVEKEKLKNEVKLLEEANTELRQRLSEINEKYLKLLEENAHLNTKMETKSDSKKNFPTEAGTVYVYGPQEFKIVIKNEFASLFNLKDQLKILAEKFEDTSATGTEMMKSAVQGDLKRAVHTLISSCGNVEAIISKYSPIFRDIKDCVEDLTVDTEERCSKENEKICFDGKNVFDKKEDLIFERSDLGDRELQAQQNTETLKNEFVAHLIELKELTEIHDSEIYNILQKLIQSDELSNSLPELISNLESLKEKSSALCLQVECVIDLLHMNNENLLNLFVHDLGIKEKYSLKESCNSLEIQVCSDQSAHEFDKDIKVSSERNFTVAETVMSQNELPKNISIITNECVKEGDMENIVCSREMDGNEARCVPSDVLLNIFKENLHLKTQLAVTKQLLTRQLPEYNIDSVSQYSPITNEEKSLNDIIAENASLRCELQKAKFEFEELEKELKEMLLQKCTQPLITGLNEKEKLQIVTFPTKDLKSDKDVESDGDLSSSENVRTSFSLHILTDAPDLQKKPLVSHDKCVAPESSITTDIGNDIPLQHSEGCHNENNAHKPEMVQQTVLKPTVCEVATAEVHSETQISKVAPDLISRENTIDGVMPEECTKRCNYSQSFEVKDCGNMKLHEQQVSDIGEEMFVGISSSKQIETGNNIFDKSNKIIVDGSDCTQLSNLNNVVKYHCNDLLVQAKHEESDNEQSNICSSKKAIDSETDASLTCKDIGNANFHDTVKYHYNDLPLHTKHEESNDEQSNRVSSSKKTIDSKINASSTSKGRETVNLNDAVKYHYSDFPVQAKHERSDDEQSDSISTSNNAVEAEINASPTCKFTGSINLNKDSCKHSNKNGTENNEPQFCTQNEQICKASASHCNSQLFAQDHSYPETNINATRNHNTSYYDTSECSDIVENDLFKISHNPKGYNSVQLGISENDCNSNQNTIASTPYYRGFKTGADGICGDKASQSSLNTGNKCLGFSATANGSKCVRKKVVNSTKNSKTESGITAEMTVYNKSGSYSKAVGKQQGIASSRNPKFYPDREAGKRNVHFYHKFSKMGVDGSDSLETSTTGGSSDTESEYPPKTCNFKQKHPVEGQENDCGSLNSPSSDSTLCHEDTETEESCEKNENFKFHTTKVRRGTSSNNKTLEKGNYMSKFTTISEDFTKPYQKCYLKEHHQAEMKEKASFNYSSSETCSSSSVSKGKQCHMNSKRDMYSGRQSRIPTYIKPFGRRSSTNSVNVNNQCSKTDNQNCLLKLNKTFSERNISEYTKDSNLGNKMKCNKNASKNASAGGNSHLQSELQTEREKVRKHAVCIRRLKSELQLMKNSMVENKKLLVLGHNSQLSRQRNSSVSAPHSPHHYSFTAAEFQKQVNELEQKVNEEHALRFSLEVQVNKMRYELQEKFNIEKELMLLQNKLENDFVSKTEMDAVKRNYEAALAKARQDAELSVYDDLRHKLHQINIFIEKQAQEQANITHLQNINESQMQQEFKEISLKILSDFAKVQATLQEKDEKEKELKEKYEKLIKECEKEQEVQRKKLIEKSYSVNLTPYMNKKVKDVNSKSCMLDISSSQRSSSLQSLCARHSTLPVPAVPHSSNSPWVPDNALNYILHREMEDSISKNSSSDDAAIQSSTNKPLSATEEQLEILRLKYFVY
ncbi:uncharacterized protein LOC124722186 [Schistocerca piceifrons]|uniref:uncharacterized protein LOC124722186 n=1 Tax=Schistocerca piceifrons TaxID=274613 RepID=UPI001F5ECFE3|nr:uncharacterized protein LOC124722186 [Schistocerca piceifrons]